jgi:rhodanese-related sulfurtransferase
MVQQPIGWTRTQALFGPLAAAVALVLGLVLGGCDHGTSDSEIKIIQIAQFRAMVDEAKAQPAKTLIVDARSQDEFRAGHVEGARNIRAEQLRPESPMHVELAKYEQIAVYGADPASGTSKSTVKRMMDGGARKVFWFQGGMKFWRAAAYPVVQTPGSDPKPVNISPNTQSPPPSQPQPTPLPSGIPR